MHRQHLQEQQFGLALVVDKLAPCLAGQSFDRGGDCLGFVEGILGEWVHHVRVSIVLHGRAEYGLRAVAKTRLSVAGYHSCASSRLVEGKVAGHVHASLVHGVVIVTRHVVFVGGVGRRGLCGITVVSAARVCVSVLTRHFVDILAFVTWVHIRLGGFSGTSNPMLEPGGGKCCIFG